MVDFSINSVNNALVPANFSHKKFLGMQVLFLKTIRKICLLSYLTFREFYLKIEPFSKKWLDVCPI